MERAGCQRSLVERLLPARGPDRGFFEEGRIVTAGAESCHGRSSTRSRSVKGSPRKTAMPRRTRVSQRSPRPTSARSVTDVRAPAEEPGRRSARSRPLTIFYGARAGSCRVPTRFFGRAANAGARSGSGRAPLRMTARARNDGPAVQRNEALPRRGRGRASPSASGRRLLLRDDALPAGRRGGWRPRPPPGSGWPARGAGSRTGSGG